jgi:hypothetical protein
MLKYLKKQLSRLEGTKRKVLDRDPSFDTTNLSKEIQQLRLDIDAAKLCLSSYYSNQDPLPRSKNR